MTRPCAACGATDNVRLFKDGPACPEHTPAAIAGHVEPPIPDPERTMAGMMRAAGADPTRSITPAGVTHIDAERVRKGKTRTDLNGYRAVQQQHEDRRRGDLRAVPAPQEATTAPQAPDGPAGGVMVRPLDAERLSAQSRRVWDVLLDGQWRTLRELADAAHAPEASVSARFREFRSEEFGSQPMEAEPIPGSSQFRYRLAVERLAHPQPA